MAGRAAGAARGPADAAARGRASASRTCSPSTRSSKSAIAKRNRRSQQAGRRRTESRIDWPRGRQSRGELAALQSGSGGSRERLRWRPSRARSGPARAGRIGRRRTPPCKTAAGARGVAARGRLEPWVASSASQPPSTPDAVSGAVLSKLLRGPRRRRHGRPAARRDRYRRGRAGAPGRGARPNSRRRGARPPRPPASRTRPACSPTWRRGSRGARRTCWAGDSPRARRPSRPRAMPMPARPPARRDVPSARVAESAHSVRGRARGPLRGRDRALVHPRAVRRPRARRACAGPASSWASTASSSSAASTRCTRSPRSTRPTSARAAWASARWSRSPALAAGPHRHRGADPAQGAEDGRDRHRSRRPQGRAHRRGRDPARRPAARPRT